MLVITLLYSLVTSRCSKFNAIFLERTVLGLGFIWAGKSFVLT